MNDDLPEHLRQSWLHLYKRARERCPNLDVRLVVGDADLFPEDRDHAALMWLADENHAILHLAPRMLTAPWYRVEGVLAHELGHALMFAGGQPRHSEREADDMAAAALGTPVYYDAEDIQTVRWQPGHARTRPGRLPR